MMCVVAGPSVKELHDDIGLVIAVCVFKPQIARLIDDDDTAVPEFEASRAVELVVKHGAFRPAIAVLVFEDEKPVVRMTVARFPLRVRRHAAGPQSAAIVEAKLIRLRQLWELAVAGKQLHLKAVRDGHRLDALLWREVPQLLGLRVILLRVAKTRRRNEELTRLTVVRWGRGLALGNVPRYRSRTAAMARILTYSRGKVSVSQVRRPP